MGYQSKIQLAGKSNNPQWHINIPNALAKAINLQKGEEIEWEVESRTLLVLVRKSAPIGRKLKIQAPS
jgi:antitoxin component of MazEF toxin-antitoxin module